ESLYVTRGERLSECSLYIRNAIRRSEDKPNATASDWTRFEAAMRAVQDLSDALQCDRPLLVVSFGAFSFEVCRRAFSEVLGEAAATRSERYWTVARLGEEFRQRRAAAVEPPTLAPLLHVSIARGRFLTAHAHYCGDRGLETPNYFSYV